MTRSQAIRIYLNNFSLSDAIIRRLMQWNGKETIRQNADRMKLTVGTAAQLKKRYKLPFKKVGSGNNFKGVMNKSRGNH